VLGGWPVPGTTRLDIEMPSIDAANATVRDLGLRGVFDGERLAIEALTATLPGGTDFSAKGDVALSPAGIRYDLALEAASEDLRTVLGWTGLQLGDVAPRRLRRADTDFTFVGRPDDFVVDDLRLTLDGAVFEGGFAFVAAG